MNMSASTNISSWTLNYVKQNTKECTRVAFEQVPISKMLIETGNYSKAADSWRGVIIGFDLLSQIDRVYYEYAYNYAFVMAQVCAFGIQNLAKAKFCTSWACKFARKSLSRTADRDLKKMQAFLDALESGMSVDDLELEFDIDFPTDTLAIIKQH